MFRAFFRTRSGVLALVVLLLLFLMAVIGPQIWGDKAGELGIDALNQRPSGEHLLGTDQLGRDILARLVVASRLSLGLAVAAAGLGALIGIPLGAGAASLPRRLRTASLRIIDALVAFPGILVAILAGAVMGPGSMGALFGVALALAFFFARVASSLTLAIGGREFIAAARVAGIGGPRLVMRYVLPNIAETLVITTTVAVGTSIVAISTLSFLGLGVQSPRFDWGRMLTEGVQAMYFTPMAAAAPAIAIAVTSLAFGLAGEALARAMNPVLWTSQPSVRAQLSSGAPTASEQAMSTEVRRPSAAQTDESIVLEVCDLRVEFPTSTGFRPVVDGVSFTLRRAERLGIVGESGSGKTSTALAIAQLVSFPGVVTGQVFLTGHELTEMPPRQRNALLGTDLAVVYQDPLSSLNPALTIGTQLTESIRVHRGATKEEANRLAAERLREVDIATPERQLGRHPHELSGGMRQRAVIAMGLMTRPAVLIADEPTTALDVTVQSQIMDVLERIGDEYETALVLVSHNLGLISQNCDRVLVMYAGRVVEELPAAALSTGARHPYTRALLGAVPGMRRPREEALAYIPGQAPDPADLPTGCPFHPRCPLAVQKCKEVRPPLESKPGVVGAAACWVANEDLA